MGGVCKHNLTRRPEGVRGGGWGSLEGNRELAQKLVKLHFVRPRGWHAAS